MQMESAFRVQLLWRIEWDFLKKLKIVWSSNPTPEHISRENYIIWKDTCTPVFTEALFTIAETWKQPKCPSTEKWKKGCHTYIHGILLGHKEEWNNAICSNMDRPRDYHIRQRKMISYNIIHMWNLIKII